MIDALTEFIEYSIPFWAWALPLGGVGVIVGIAAYRTLGIRGALVALVAYGSLALSALSYRRGKQRGWEDRRSKEARNAQELVDRLKKARTDARSRNAHGLRDDDGFKRKP